MGASKIFVETAIKDSFSICRLDKAGLDTDFANRLIYNRVLLIENGSGTLTVDDHSFEVSSNTAFLLAKGQLYVFKQASVVTGYLLCFGDCFWEKAPSSASNCKAVLFNNAAANQKLQLSDTELRELSSLFKAMLEEFEQAPYNNQMDALAAYLKIIMIKLANIKLTDETMFDSQDYILYRQFMEILTSHFKSYREVSDYAKLMGITARRLSDLCRRCSNKSAKEIINGQLVAEAKRSLQFSSIPVKELAYELNFNSPEQFSHFFKKNTKFSPASYRDQFLNIGVNV
ncbi:helix-turn-helix domain-containing protein [Desertivirga arenae]|uniref:helix-turn-helix domain-containing protein n=1 Tax=Desertivirga arenae TaxID=2810309 RepID=UPI001A97C782|nr:AraC family transcriptional regulator [Pedobacter sp. SYSU D00823]